MKSHVPCRNYSNISLSPVRHQTAFEKSILKVFFLYIYFSIPLICNRNFHHFFSFGTMAMARVKIFVDLFSVFSRNKTHVKKTKKTIMTAVLRFADKQPSFHLQTIFRSKTSKVFRPEQNYFSPPKLTRGNFI